MSTRQPTYTSLVSIGFAALLAIHMAPFSFGEDVVSVEAGRDVGDGLVLDDLPYDPKAIEGMVFVSPTPAHPF